MAKPQEKQALFFTTTPIIKPEQERIDAETSSATLCGCFRLFRFTSRGPSNDREDSRRLLNDHDHDHHQHKETGTTTWLENNLKSVKEFTEVVAGPKWKNFIRKLGKLFNNKEKRRNHFQYDSYSYALNFDDGHDHENLLNGYSPRFAAAGDRERR